MARGEPTTEVVVSIQATGMEATPWEGHLAAGVLGGEDVVIVPNPPAELLDPSRGFEALIIPKSLDAEAPIERIRIAGMEAMRPVDSDRVTSLFAKLAGRSRYVAFMPTFDGCRLREELRARGDLWTALENVGAIRPGEQVVPAELLRGVPDVERAQRERRIRFHPYRESGDDAFDICDYILWCDPCRPA